MAFKGEMHGRDHAPNGSDPISVVLYVQVFGDNQAVTTGDGKRIFSISQDMDTLTLTSVESYVTTVSSSGKPTVQLRNVNTGLDILSTKCEIDVSEKNSADAATQPVINAANAKVAWKDHIAVDVDVAGTGAMGLAIIVTYSKVPPP